MSQLYIFTAFILIGIILPVASERPWLSGGNGHTVTDLNVQGLTPGRLKAGRRQNKLRSMVQGGEAESGEAGRDGITGTRAAPDRITLAATNDTVELIASDASDKVAPDEISEAVPDGITKDAFDGTSNDGKSAPDTKASRERARAASEGITKVGDEAPVALNDQRKTHQEPRTRPEARPKGQHRRRNEQRRMRKERRLRKQRTSRKGFGKAIQQGNETQALGPSRRICSTVSVSNALTQAVNNYGEIVQIAPWVDIDGSVTGLLFHESYCETEQQSCTGIDRDEYHSTCQTQYRYIHAPTASSTESSGCR